MRQSDPAMHPRPTHANRPGTRPSLSADSRPGHPRNAAAHSAPVRFTDWGLI